ncbi:helicase-associated domain-containing protein [Paenibacillus sp. PR3]|uniref:Helicase-associated domain-containing protein n=1 Tax=Paenibacillus terricola TaxID=2763503 RepID=A0ABR8MR90_9BACL|nr:helicase-associated domain-containing protein [Paenibacillus terricola]MBD3918130.1 helicase-associated domain-containing protein [Paenibacillus terricola]
MRLNELLKRLPSEELNRLNQAPIWGSNHKWQDAVLCPDLLRSAAHQLSPLADRLLRYWLRTIGPLPIQEEQLRARAIQKAGLAGAELRAAIRELRMNGLLFAVRKSWGEQLLFMPADCYLAWLRAFNSSDSLEELNDGIPSGTDAGADGCSVSFGDVDRAAVPTPLGRRLVRAYAALQLLGLETTAKGLFPKKTAAGVEAIVALRSTEAFSDLRSMYQEHYPLGFTIALDAASWLGLIVHQDDGEPRWNWSDDNLGRWLTGDPNVREAELLRLFAIRYGFRNSIQAALVSGLLLLKPDKSYPISERIHPLLARWIDGMCACGWASMSAASNGGWTFRWLIDPWAVANDDESRESILVLPDGEVIVPPGASLADRWMLEQIAEWVQDDTVSIYRLTAQSIMAAAERGVTDEQLITSLQRASGGEPLPDELQYAIGHWVSRTGRTAIEQVLLLRCDSKEIADAAAGRDSLAGLLVERLGDQTFVIRPKDEAVVRRELERAGWPASKREETLQTTAPLSASANRKRKPEERRFNVIGAAAPVSFIYDEHALHLYELLTATQQLPDEARTEEAPSDWPAAWTAQLRHYHPSTRKQMIEQALAWGAPLQLRTGGRIVELVPERLDDDVDSWAVAGYLRTGEVYEPVRLLPDMWEEMRLIIPL